jgi:tetratricopeptide (TPR) repeat protein
MLKNWKAGPGEFLVGEKKNGFETLNMVPDLPELERLVGIIVECGIFSGSTICIVDGATHGAYIPIKISPFFEEVLCCAPNATSEDLHWNIEKSGVRNLSFINTIDSNLKIPKASKAIIYYETPKKFYECQPLGPHRTPVTIYPNSDCGGIKVKNTNRHLVVSEEEVAGFNKHFNYKNGEFVWDNLIHFCVMVKNGGELFEQMLEHSVANGIIDRWTVLDTGSTDGTVEAVRRVLGESGIEGNLYEEPFINFRDSRNRCLNLAESREKRPPCKYSLMVDDTYCVQGNLRGFLESVRGDQVASSFSLLVRSSDVEYLSCRVTVAELKLRYKYTLHEVIQDENNLNVRIPAEFCMIQDTSNEFMKERTVSRKEYDLQCLFDMLAEEPDNSRHLYYIAQTFSIMKEYRKAAEYFRLRIEHPVHGFKEERDDALLELVRIEHQHLGVPFETCLMGYKKYSEQDPVRPDGHYFIGVQYYRNGENEKAYQYFKKAFEIGFPGEKRQYSLRPTISQHFVPLFLTELAHRRDSDLGAKAALHFLRESTIATIEEKSLVTNWLEIHYLVSSVKAQENKKIVCFVAPGGFGQWDGNSINTGGIGGSETWIIETARCMAKETSYGAMDVYVFCDCPNDQGLVVDGVHYRQIVNYLEFAGRHRITHCIISRFSEFIPAALASKLTENVHFIMHDVRPSGNIIPLENKLQTIFCLSEWHRKLFASQFPQFPQLRVQGYGVREASREACLRKTPASFIYSSFANRGLSTVLKLWPRIRSKYGNATLSVFCDLKNSWALQHHGAEIALIENLLEALQAHGVTNYGWISKPALRMHWEQSLVWLYPCRFEETFCHTALEAAASKTLAITNGLAALNETAAQGRTARIVNDDESIMACLGEMLTSSGHLTAAGQELVAKNYEWVTALSWENKTKLFSTAIKL